MTERQGKEKGLWDVKPSPLLLGTLQHFTPPIGWTRVWKQEAPAHSEKNASFDKMNFLLLFFKEKAEK